MIDPYHFDDANILVVGDVMLDSYWQGKAARISPEAPVPVVNVQQVEARLGGAANVALNIQSIGAKVRLIGVCGEDNDAEELSSLLECHQIKNHLVRYKHISTIRKLRVLSQNQQLLRLDFESPYQGLDFAPFRAAFLQQLDGVDLVILSDYGKGTLSETSWCIAQCRQRELPVLVDPKGHDFDRYRGATGITPNLSEFEKVVGPCTTQDIFETKAVQLRQRLNLDTLLVTQGAKGMTLFSQQPSPTHLPAYAKAVFDVTGAGDTVIAVWGGCMAAGLNELDALRYANYAAGQVVAKVGTATVNRDQLMLAPFAQRSDWISADQLRTLMTTHQERLLVHHMETEQLSVSDVVKFQQHASEDGIVAFIYDSERGPRFCSQQRQLVAATGFCHFHACLSPSETRALMTQVEG